MSRDQPDGWAQVALIHDARPHYLDPVQHGPRMMMRCRCGHEHGQVDGSSRTISDWIELQRAHEATL